MVVKSQATRSRSQNRKIARRILAENLEEKEKGPESRKALKIEAIRKKKANKRKKSNKKYGNTKYGNSNKNKQADEGIMELNMTNLAIDDDKTSQNITV